MKWAYGVTTVPQRRGDLLPRTLASLKAGGFEEPRLFVDGAKDLESWEQEFKVPVTVRYPTIRTFGNWFLSLAELFIREPTAERFAVFQDDLICSRNIRQYMERCVYPQDGYNNLYNFPCNQNLAPKNALGGTIDGWYPSNQMGRGAVALVFSRQAVTTLLSQPHMIERPLDAHRGWRAVDGGIVTAFKKAGWREYVHSPSLVQHTGQISSMGNRPHKQATSFKGEQFDALELL